MASNQQRLIGYIYENIQILQVQLNKEAEFAGISIRHEPAVDVGKEMSTSQQV